MNLYPKDFTVSPIKGPAGNTEYLIFLSDSKENVITFDYAEKIIDETQL